MIQHRNLKTNQVFFLVNNVYKRSESVTFVIADLPGDILGTAGCSSAAAQQHKMTRERRFTSCFFWYREGELCYSSIKLARNTSF